MRESVKAPVVLVATVTLTLALAACGGGDSADKTVNLDTATVTDEATPTSTDEAAPATTDDAGSDSTTASTSDLCALLNNDTITSITGVDFSKAVVTDDGTGTCTWDLTSTGGLAMVSIISTDSEGTTSEMNRAIAASMFDDVTDVSVAGADDAFTYMGGVVVALDLGGEYVQVMYMNFGEDAGDASAPIKLAEEVVKNW